jgi:uncharacterized protein (DUF1015 family)
MSSTADLVVQYATLDDEVSVAEGSLKAKKKLLAELNTRLTERFGIEKIQKMSVEVNGRNKTVYLRKQYWAKKNDGVDGEAVYDALVDSGLSELAQRTYNANTLSAYLREQFKQNKEYELPEQLASVVAFREVEQVVSTGS